ncbi:MAG TPA: diacylglycerol kinase family protein [Ktedonobacterales bacterium]|nr:diacylglycerol kinase family protein [Ktedonobacterales bacterium]
MRVPGAATTVSPQVSGAASPDATPVVILNPASNYGRAARLRKAIERALLGGRGELMLTAARGDATRLAIEAARAGRAVVVVGGDGAIHEAASGVVASHSSVPFGVVPAGSGNDFALHVAHAPLDPIRALDIALTAPIAPTDVGVVNGEYFVNALSVGLDANVAVRAERHKRFGLSGHPLYMSSALTELLLRYDDCPTLTLQYDDEPPVHQIFALVAMSIGPTYGGGFKINPGADPRDGYFDMCALSKPPLHRALRLLPAVEHGKHVGEPETRIVRCRRVTIESERPVNAQLDGELTRATRFEVSLLPGALALRCGPASAVR